MNIIFNRNILEKFKYHFLLKCRIDELESEVECQRVHRIKVERQKSDVEKEIGELAIRLEEAGEVAIAQSNLIKRRESEILR